MVCFLNIGRISFLLFSGCRGSVSFYSTGFSGEEIPMPTRVSCKCCPRWPWAVRLQFPFLIDCNWKTSSAGLPVSAGLYGFLLLVRMPMIITGITAWSWLYGRRNDRAPAFGRLLRLVYACGTTAAICIITYPCWRLHYLC